MHFDRDLHAVVFGELGALGPVWRHLLVPLPRKEVKVFGRPGAGYPVRILGLLAIAGAAREIDHHRNAELLGQLDGSLVHVLVVLSALGIGMLRIALST